MGFENLDFQRTSFVNDPLCYCSLSLDKLIEGTNDLLGTHITVIASLVLHDFYMVLLAQQFPPFLGK